MQQGAPPELRRQKLHIVYKQMTPTEFLIWETILEYEEYHSITYKPIIAPEEHPVCRNTHPKTNRVPLGTACVESYHLHCLNEQQQTTGRYLRSSGIGNHIHYKQMTPTEFMNHLQTNYSSGGASCL